MRWGRPCLTAAARACKHPPRISGRVHRAGLSGWDEEDGWDEDDAVELAHPLHAPVHSNGADRTHKHPTSGSSIAATAVPVRLALHLETLDKLGASADADSATGVDSTAQCLLEGKEVEEGRESYRHALREHLPCSTFTLYPAPNTLLPETNSPATLQNLPTPSGQIHTPVLSPHLAPCSFLTRTLSPPPSWIFSTDGIVDQDSGRNEPSTSTFHSKPTTSRAITLR